MPRPGNQASLRNQVLLRYSCLITGILMALLFLTVLITCRLTGFPVAEEYGANSAEQAAEQIGG